MRAVKQFKDGVLIYEPWYGAIMETLRKVAPNLPVSVRVDKIPTPEILDELAITIEEMGVALTLSLVDFIWLLILKATDRIYRGVQVSGSVTTEVKPSVTVSVTESDE